MSGAKNVIDMRPSKGFSPSQGNEHLRRLDDCERAQKARWNYDPSREHLNLSLIHISHRNERSWNPPHHTVEKIYR